jgi:CheY-like chemotaxis protein
MRACHGGPRFLRRGEVSPSILLVEDDDSVRRSLLRTLHARGINAVGVADGMEAIQHALASPPDLIIMDLQLPAMSGPDVLRQLRTHDALASIPVIALSATLEGAPLELFARALMKPCSTDSLLKAISEAMAQANNVGRLHS